MSESHEERVVKSYCRNCHGGCDVLVYAKEGCIINIEGDPEFPANPGSMCAKGLGAM